MFHVDMYASTMKIGMLNLVFLIVLISMSVSAKMFQLFSSEHVGASRSRSVSVVGDTFKQMFICHKFMLTFVGFKFHTKLPALKILTQQNIEPIQSYKRFNDIGSRGDKVAKTQSGYRIIKKTQAVLLLDWVLSACQWSGAVTEQGWKHPTMLKTVYCVPDNLSPFYKRNVKTAPLRPTQTAAAASKLWKRHF